VAYSDAVTRGGQAAPLPGKETAKALVVKGRLVNIVVK
jgi:hypothetical protein